MARLTLRLLGAPQFRLDEKPLDFDRQKVGALLIYLAVKSAPVGRDHLTNLLFPDLDRVHAKGDFRQILSILKSTLGDDLLRADRNFVSLARDVQTDIREFRSLLAEAKKTSSPSLWERALSLYQGDFLAGFYLKKNAEFENWQMMENEAARRELLNALGLMTDYFETASQWEPAIRWCQRWAQEDPFDEEAHRRLMRYYAQSGQPSLAKLQYDRCRSLLETEFACSPDEETVRLWDEIQKRSGNLPVVPYRLIGRQIERETLLALIRECSGGLVTLAGPPGVGKTRLALEIAAEVQDSFPDGVFFVDLTPVVDPGQILPSVATVLGLRDPRGLDRDVFSLLVRALGHSRTFLVLDNFEHVLAGAPALARLALACPRLRILVTSREHLGISGETLFSLSPLDLSSAAQLFSERARFLKPGRESADMDAIRKVCQFLDCLPLAIELVAARSSVLTAQELRVRLLKGHPLDSGLQQEIDRSFLTLDQQTQRLFVALGAFIGSASLEAVEDVCGSHEAEFLWKGLETLQAKNLVRRTEVRGQSRFSLLDSIATFARTRGGDSSEFQTIGLRCAEFFLNWVRQLRSAFHGPGQLEALARLEDDRPNLNKAMQFFLDHGLEDESMDMAISLHWFWYRAGHLEEGIRWLRRCLDSDLRNDDGQRAEALRGLGWLTFTQGNWAEARGLFLQSLSLLTESKDRFCRGRVLSDFGVVLRWMGEFEAGTRFLEEALILGRESGDTHQLLVAQIWAFATTGGRQVDPRQREELESALRVSRETGDLWVTAHALNGLGDLCRVAGDPAAVEFYEESLEQFHLLKDSWMMAWNWEGLGKWYENHNQLAEARRSLTKGFSLFSLLGDRQNAILLLPGLALAEEQSGNQELAGVMWGAYEGMTGQELTIGSQLSRRDLSWARGRTLSYDQIEELVVDSTGAKRTDAASR